MEDMHVEVAQPPHLNPFVPVAPKEVQERLDRMPFPIACWYARELRRVIRGYKQSWYWYYNQVHVLWLYLDSFDEVLFRFPSNPSPLPLRTKDGCSVTSMRFGAELTALRRLSFGKLFALTFPCGD